MSAASPRSSAGRATARAVASRRTGARDRARPPAPCAGWTLAPHQEAVLDVIERSTRALNPSGNNLRKTFLIGSYGVYVMEESPRSRTRTPAPPSRAPRPAAHQQDHARDLDARDARHRERRAPLRRGRGEGRLGAAHARGHRRARAPCARAQNRHLTRFAEQIAAGYRWTGARSDARPCTPEWADLIRCGRTRGDAGLRVRPGAEPPERGRLLRRVRPGGAERRGWVPIATNPPIEHRDCLTACDCWMQFRNSRTGALAA
jgi:hypothetical protein